MFVFCLVELWEMRSDDRTLWTPACLSCGWVGSDTHRRAAAVADGRRHEEGLRDPWQMAAGEHSGWDGDPRSRPDKQS